MNPETRKKFREHIADVTYKVFISTTRSEDYVADLLKFKLDELNATKKDYKIIAEKYAEIYEEKLYDARQRGVSLGENRKTKLVVDSISEVTEWFKNGGNQNE